MIQQITRILHLLNNNNDDSNECLTVVVVIVVWYKLNDNLKLKTEDAVEFI